MAIFLDKTRRSAHHQKRLNKTNLTKTQRHSTNYYKECGATAKAAALSAGIGTNNGTREGEGEGEGEG